MAMKLIAVQGFSYVFSNTLVNATVVLSGVPSVKNLAGGKQICKHSFSAIVTNITVPSSGATIPDPGPYNVTFSSTSTKNKADNAFVLRVDDETGIINAVPQIPGSPPTPYPVSFRLKISNAGQTKVSGE